MTGSPEDNAAGKVPQHSYRALFWGHSALPFIACIVFVCAAYLSISHNQSYWLTGLLATLPAVGVLALWVIRSRQLDRWVCPWCGKPLPKQFLSLRFSPHEKCSSCGEPISLKDTQDRELHSNRRADL
jgi:predicted RNA-binding Zn-ribbon protein involved in translation (DUF1610 family)